MADQSTLADGGAGASAEAGQPQADAPEPTSSTEAGTEEAVATEQNSDKKASSKQEKVNLQEFEEFKQYQAAAHRQLEQARRRAEQAEAQAKQLTEAQERAKMASMNDFEREKYLRTKAEEEAKRAKNQLEILQIEKRIETDLLNLSEKTGIPVAELKEAETWQEAQMLAIEKMKANMDKEVKRRIKEAREADKVNAADLGGGKTQTPPDTFEERLRQAGTAKDYVATLLMQKQAEQQ